MELHELVDHHHGELLDIMYEELHSSTAPHYRDADLGELRSRCERLIDEFTRAVRGSPNSLGDYLCDLAEKRMAEGYALDELQLALNVLEHEVWRLTARTVDDKPLLLQLLSLTTGTIGSAKDRLARSYLAAMQRADARANGLSKELETLFKGTDANDT